MSGGHWNYAQWRVRDEIAAVAADEEVRRRWPRTAERLASLAEELHDVIRAMDWDLSADTHIADDAAFDADASARLTQLRDEEVEVVDRISPQDFGCGATIVMLGADGEKRYAERATQTPGDVRVGDRLRFYRDVEIHGRYRRPLA